MLPVRTETGAAQALATVADRQRQHLLVLEDAASVRRSVDGKPRVKQAHRLVGAGA